MSILEQAKAVQAKRKKRYGDADKKRNSKIRRKPTEKNLEVWSRNPGRSDIIGVDGEGTPTLKRDQEPTPRPKRKKAAPKRKKAEVKAQPKAEPKAEPKPEFKISDYPDTAIAYAVNPWSNEDIRKRLNKTEKDLDKASGAALGGFYRNKGTKQGQLAYQSGEIGQEVRNLRYALEIREKMPEEVERLRKERGIKMPKEGGLTGVVNGPDLSDWKAFNRFTVLKVTGPLVNRKYVTFAVRWQKGSIKEYEYSGPGIRQRETKLYDYGSKAREYLAKKVRDYITSLQNARIKAGLEPAKIEFLQIAKPSDTYMDPGYRYMTEKEIGEYIKSDAVYRDVLQQDLNAYLKAKELRENPPKMTPEQEAELTKKADFSYIELAKKRRKELIQQRKQIKGRDAGLEAKIRNEGYKIDRFSEKKKKPQADTGRYELRKWVPGSDETEAYQVYVGEAPKKLVGLIFKRKPDKFPREYGFVRRDPWGFTIYEQGQDIYTSGPYDGFKTKEKAITGLKNRWGFDRIYGYWEKVQESYEKRKDEPRSAQYEAEAYRAMTDKDARRSISAYNSMELYNTMAYLYSKGYVIPLPTGWNIGIPEYAVYNLKKGSNFDKWNPVLPESLSVQLEGKNWWKAPGAGTEVSRLQEIAKEYGTSKGYDFADLSEYQQKRLKNILPITIDEAERRDEIATEGLGNIVGVSDRFKRYWNVFVKSANDAVPLKTASDAMRDLTYRDYDEAGGRRRQEWFTDISEAETSSVEVLLKRKASGRLSKEEIAFLFEDDAVAAYMLKAREKLFMLVGSYFAGLNRQASSAYTGGGNFPVRRMLKIQEQNDKKLNVLIEEIKKYKRILKDYFNGSKFQAKKELGERRERAEELGLKAVRKEVDLGVWEYDPGTSRLNFEPAQMLDPDMRTKLRRSPYAMKWSPRFKQYTRVVALGSVPTVGLRNALKRDFDFDLPLPVNAKAIEANKEETIQGRRIKQRPDGLWQVQSEENRQRAERGERELGGDLIYSTREEAIEDINQQAEVERQNEAFRKEVDDREAKIAQQKAKKDAPLNEYLAAVGSSQMQTGKLKATLTQQAARRDSSTGNIYRGTRQEVVAKMVRDGWSPAIDEVPALKQKKRAELNRMDVKEYEAWEKKRKEAGTKAEYVLKKGDDRIFVVTKVEYDYAVWLKSNKDNPESIVDNLSAADRSKVSMKIDELAQLADEAKAKGEAAPNYNLCEITIPGTNIYCEGNKGIERAKMPQFKGTPVPGSPAAKLPKDSKGEVDTEPIFRKQLKEEGIAITPKEIYSDNLKATQSELVGAKVAGMTKALEANPNNPGITAPIFVSNDNYVIDGHHRWAAVTSYAIKNGLPKKMKVEVIDLPIEEAIKKSNDFADMIGIAQKAAKTEGESQKKAAPAQTGSMDAMIQDALGLDVTWAERKAELMSLAKKYEQASGPARKEIELLYYNNLDNTTRAAEDRNAKPDAVCAAMIVQLEIFPNVMRKLRSSVEVSPEFYPYGFNLVTGGMIPNNYLKDSPLWKYMDDLFQTVMYDIKPLKKSKYKLQTQALGTRNMNIVKGKLGKWKENLKLAVPYLKPYFGKDDLRPAMNNAYVDSFGFTATNAFKLIHLDAENSDWPLNESGSGVYPSPTAKNDFGDRIEEKYPNWKAVIPSTTAEEAIYVQGTNLERLYKFIMMQTDYRMFLPVKTVYNIFFKTENSFTAFNTALLLDVVQTVYKLGQSSVTVLFYGETRPSLWVPGTFNSKVVDAERNTYVLLMPVLATEIAKRFGSKSANVLARGGYVHGPSHEQGGVTMPVGSSGRMVELEGGEGVVNKRSMASQKTITLNGKRMKPCQAVSQINQMDGNGVPITC